MGLEGKQGSEKSTIFPNFYINCECGVRVWIHIWLASEAYALPSIPYSYGNKSQEEK